MYNVKKDQIKNCLTYIDFKGIKKALSHHMTYGLLFVVTPRVLMYAHMQIDVLLKTICETEEK